MAMQSPSIIGARAEMAVAGALHRRGWEVYTPLFAPQSRVDLVAMNEERLLRIQCKTSRILRPGALFFRTCSNTRNVPIGYAEQADAFGVYSPELEQVFLVPVDEVSTRGAILRLEPTRNGQSTGVRWASDYLVGPP